MQDWRGANITSGAGGSAGPGGKGGRGGDVGSHNRTTTNTHKTHNDHSKHTGNTHNNYHGDVDQSDNYNGAISGSNVGGRGNKNSVKNGRR